MLDKVVDKKDLLSKYVRGNIIIFIHYHYIWKEK